MDEKELQKIGKILKEYKNSVFLEVESKDFKDAVKKIAMGGVKRIISIAGVDNGSDIEAIYIFDDDYRIINLKTRIPREKSKVETIIGLFPGAQLFEREFSEMLDVEIEGNPDPQRLFLAPDSPKGPLRKK